MSTYTRKFTRVEFTEVEVIVEDAATEEEAESIAEQFVDLGEGKYRASADSGLVYVTINETIEDSEMNESDEEPEWEPDEEEEEQR